MIDMEAFVSTRKFISIRHSLLLHTGQFKTMSLSLPGRSVWKDYSLAYVHSLL